MYFVDELLLFFQRNHAFYFVDDICLLLFQTYYFSTHRQWILLIFSFLMLVCGLVEFSLQNGMRTRFEGVPHGRRAREWSGGAWDTPGGLPKASYINGGSYPTAPRGPILIHDSRDHIGIIWR